MTDVDGKVFHFTGMPFPPEGLRPMRLALRDGVPSYKICESIYMELVA